MMPRGYRFIFFDQFDADAVAAFRLHLMSDDIAIAEARLLLAVSSHRYVEVWLAGACIHIERKADAAAADSAENSNRGADTPGTKGL